MIFSPIIQYKEIVTQLSKISQAIKLRFFFVILRVSDRFEESIDAGYEATKLLF